MRTAQVLVSQCSIFAVPFLLTRRVWALVLTSQVCVRMRARVCGCKQIGTKEKVLPTCIPTSFVCFFRRSSFKVPIAGSSVCSVNIKHSLHATNRNGGVLRMQKNIPYLLFTPQIHPHFHFHLISFGLKSNYSSSLSFRAHMVAHDTQKHTQMQITQAWCNYCSLGKFYPFPAEKWPANENHYCNMIQNNH